MWPVNWLCSGALLPANYLLPCLIPSSAHCCSTPTGLVTDLWFGSHLCMMQFNSSYTSFANSWPSSSHTAPALAQSKLGQIFISNTQAKKKVHVHRSHHKNKNNMNGQNMMFSIKLNSHIEILSNENYPDEL